MPTFFIICFLTHGVSSLNEPEQHHQFDETFNIVNMPYQEEEENKKFVDCRSHEDCPEFAYCVFPPDISNGGTCQTKLEVTYDSVSCHGTDKNGNLFPQHDICRMAETNITGVNETYSTARCYEELNYTCVKSYFMPCTPNYDYDGSDNRGEEESCPNHFSCTKVSSGRRKSIKVCVPNGPDISSHNKLCQTNFDCGYSRHLDEWRRCEDGVCQNETDSYEDA